MIKFNEHGAVALLTVIIVTSVALVFGVSLAIMNLDYSLTSGFQLFNRQLVEATDACLDQAVIELRRNSSISTLNVNDIGPSNIDCVVDITGTGGKRFLRARATSTAAFFNTVHRATTTVDVSTNPYTIDDFQDEVDSLSSVFTNSVSSPLAMSAFASAKHMSLALDGQYAYVPYYNSSGRMDILKVDLSTFTVDATLSLTSLTSSYFTNALVHNGYLYVVFTYNGNTDISILRVDLNNFTIDGTTILLDPVPTADMHIAYASIGLAALGQYVYVAYPNANQSGELGMWKIDTNNFSVSGITTREQITPSYCSYYNLTLHIYENFAIVSCRAGQAAGSTGVYKFDVVDNFSSSDVSFVDASSDSEAYGSSSLIGNYLYVVSGSSTTNIEINKVNVNTMVREDNFKYTGVTSDCYFCDTAISNNNLYICEGDTGFDLGVIKVDLRDFTYDSILEDLTTYNYGYRYFCRVSGDYLYVVNRGTDVTYPNLWRIAIE